MSASIHRRTCHQLGVCQDRQPPCDSTCAQTEQPDEPLLRAESCQCQLAKVVILVLGVALGGVIGLHLLWR